VARLDLSKSLAVLNAADIRPMPLKGILLQHLVYDDPAERVLSDVDLLIAPGRFEDAIAALRREGYRIDVEGRTGRATRGPDARFETDVHRSLFAPGLFRMSARAMFSRGTRDDRTFGGAVVVPHPLDLYAHLVGNFAKGRHGPGDGPQIADLERVARRFALTPEMVATHLAALGLDRAARYTLPHAASTGDEFAASVLERASRDPIGDLSAAAARAITNRFGSGSLVSALAPHLVNSSLPRGVVSGAMHGALGLRARWASS
jgi:hypothetical protein